MKPDVYDQHRRAFANVGAYVVLDSNRQQVARIALKYGVAVHAFVHWLGVPMTKGHAGEVSVACADAASTMELVGAPDATADEQTAQRLFIGALLADNGRGWDRALRDAGFIVLAAINN